jgi:hypothetical protein
VKYVRAQIQPPDALLSLVFPGVDEDLGKLVPLPASLDGVLLLIRHMKEVFPAG